MIGVQHWAEIRRLVLVEGRSQREVALLMGLACDTAAKAVLSETPPKCSRAPAGVEAGSVSNRGSVRGCGRSDDPSRAAPTSATSNLRFVGGSSDAYEVYCAVTC